jgi:hypothetical protein
MLRRVALIRTGLSEESSTSIIMVTRIGELITANVVSCHPDDGGANFLRKVSDFFQLTPRQIPEDVLHKGRAAGRSSYHTRLYEEWRRL